MYIIVYYKRALLSIIIIKVIVVDRMCGLLNLLVPIKFKLTCTGTAMNLKMKALDRQTGLET
jgi:hypothetical protein